MRLLPGLCALFRRRKLDAEMAEEMRVHLDMLAERKREEGMSAEEARFAARREFGGVEQIKERVREQRGGLWLDQIARDWRQAWRTFAKAPLVSVAIVLSLGAGIGVNTVIFSWIRGLVFRPLPGVAHAAELRLVEPRTENGSYPGASWSEYRDLKERMPAVRDLFAFKMLPLSYGEPGQDTRVYAQLVSGNYFKALGTRPALGRLLRDDDAAKPGGTAVAVISRAFWAENFASSPDAVGRTMRLNGRIVTVVGVAPEGFQGTVVGLKFDLWVPATMAPVLIEGSNELESRETRSYSLAGFLKAGATTAGAQAELDAAMAQLAASFPATNKGVTGEVLAFWRAPRGAPSFLLGALEAMQGFMALVLLVVCANAANLLLARATARCREVGVRLALGARRRQIVRMFLAESAVLGVLAAGVGVVFAAWGTNALRAVPLPGQFPFKFQTQLDWAGLVFAAALGVGCALAFGLMPGWRLARTDSQLALHTATPTAGRQRTRGALVALESALALLVLIVAAMFLRSFFETRTAQPGFKPQGVLLAAYDASNGGYDRARKRAAGAEMLRRLRTAPGVEAAAIATRVPLDFHSMPQAVFKLDSRTRSDGGSDRALTYTVSDGYFELMGMPFVAGRGFAAMDDQTAGPQAIVNEEFVREFLDGKPAPGHTIAGRDAPIEIVGVVRNALYETFGERTKPILYLSLRDRPADGAQIHVRLHDAEAAFAPTLRRIIRDIDPAIAVYDVRTLTEHVDKNLFFRKIPARIFAGLGPLILLLAAIGIYAVVAYAVAQRTSEIGVRLALGASQRRIVAQIVTETLRTVGVGVAPAWVLAVLVMLHMRGVALSGPILLGMPALLLAVAALAAWLPARRAARVDPVVALRCE
ncbi:MAG TPA: ADOP family duplicated permease [Opitutus sp.]|nr:ADOP family duplicated permease [Opitutus sp.]